MTLNILPGLTADSLRSIRGYFYVLALIIGACFTDSPSGKEQVMIAVPLMLLFEWFAIIIEKYKR